MVHIFRFTHIVYASLCSTWTYRLRFGPFCRVPYLLSSFVKPGSLKYSTSRLQVPLWSSRLVLLPVATFSMYASLGPKHTQFPFSVILDTAARGFFTLVTWNVMLEFRPSFVLQWTFFSPRLGILFPLAAKNVTQVCDPTEGLVCISGMRPSGHTDSAAPESTVIFPPVHCFSTGQRFGSSPSFSAWNLLEICSPGGYIFSLSTQPISNPPISSSTSPTSVFPLFASSFCLVQQSRGPRPFFPQ